LNIANFHLFIYLLLETFILLLQQNIRVLKLSQQRKCYSW